MARKLKQESFITSLISKYWKELLAFAVFLLAYAPTFVWMWDRWFARDSYYSHGILVPVVTFFFIWQLRGKLKEIPRSQSPWGMALIVSGILLYLASTIMRVYFTSGFSMILVFYGLILHFFGNKIFMKILFPLAFLVFMIPLPMVVITRISFKMKIFAAQIATEVLNDLRLPAIREGSIIKMRNAYVVVDDVCSGLRSLISLTALGSIFAYWMSGAMWKRVLLFASTAPIAVITNVVRVVLLSAVSEIYGTEYAEGFVHDATGYAVFGLAFVLLYMVSKLIEDDD